MDDPPDLSDSTGYGVHDPDLLMDASARSASSIMEPRHHHPQHFYHQQHHSVIPFENPFPPVHNTYQNNHQQQQPQQQLETPLFDCTHPPKRFKSSFIYFSMEQKKELAISKQIEMDVAGSERFSSSNRQRRLPPEKNTTRIVSEAWRTLVPEQRSRYEQLARNDKLRYQKELALYQNATRLLSTAGTKTSKSRKRARKAVRSQNHDDAPPKRPVSAYLAFANARRADIRKEYPTCTNGQASQTLSAKWKAAPESVREQFQAEARTKWEEYAQKMAEWKRKTGKTNKRTTRNRKESTTNIEARRQNVESCSKDLTDDFTPLGLDAGIMTGAEELATFNAVVGGGGQSGATSYHPKTTRRDQLFNNHSHQSLIWNGVSYGPEGVFGMTNHHMQPSSIPQEELPAHHSWGQARSWKK